MKKAFLPWVTREEGTPSRGELVSSTAGGASSGRTQGKKAAGHSNLGGPVRVIAYTILIFLASQLVAVFLVSLIYGLVRPHSSISVDNSITGQFFYILLAEGLSIWLVIKVVQYRRLGLGIIGLGRRPKAADVWRGLLGFAIFYGLLIIAGLVINAISPNVNNEQQNIGFNNIQNSAENILAFISLVILPPLGEETLVRGYLFGGLRKVWRFWPALLVTSVLFGFAHLEIGSGGPLVWAAAVDTFILSIVLCFLRERTGALYAGMLVHMLNNLVAFGIHFK